MSIDQKTGPAPGLGVPESLQPHQGAQLPELDLEVLDALREKGWYRIGLMVAVVDSYGRVLMQRHNKRDKNGHNVLGPLGETSQAMGRLVEQPSETLHRGIVEEIGVISPNELGLVMHASDGWVINQWPSSDRFSNRFSCAISFPVFLPDSGLEYLLENFVPNEETSSIGFYTPDEIRAMDDAELRRGVRPWLDQVEAAGLLDISDGTDLRTIDLHPVFDISATKQDITFNE